LRKNTWVLHSNGDGLRVTQTEAMQTILALAAAELKKGQLVLRIRAHLFVRI
jgi:prophage maintenance system killer protein